MPYIVTNSDGTITVTIPDKTIDTETYSFALTGQGATNWGAFLSQNLLRMVENFASTVPPAPTTLLAGQLWYDKNEALLKIYDGAKWKRATNFLVDTEQNKPATGLTAGDAFFNKSTGKLEVHDGTLFRDASYAGLVTSGFSNSLVNNNPSFLGSRVRTLFLKDTSGVSHPVLAFSYVKSTSDNSAGANKGTTQIGEQFETIMALVSDSTFTIETTGLGTETPVDGEIIDFSTELVQPGSGIASERSGRTVAQILPGINTRAEYDTASITETGQLFATTIGSVSNPVSTIYTTDLIVGSELEFDSGLISSDLTVGGDLVLSAGDLRANLGIISCANLIVSANTQLNGETTINGNINVNGVNTQTIGTDSQKIEDLFAANIDVQLLTVDSLATISTANIVTLNVSGDTVLSGNVTAGDVDLGNTTVEQFTANSIVNLDSTVAVAGVATFNSDVNLTGTANINLTSGVLNGPVTQISAVATTDATSFYLAMLDGPTGVQEVETHTGLRYNPSTSTLTAPILTTTGNATITGNLSVGTITATGDITSTAATAIGLSTIIDVDGRFIVRDQLNLANGIAIQSVNSANSGYRPLEIQAESILFNPGGANNITIDSDANLKMQVGKRLILDDDFADDTYIVADTNDSISMVAGGNLKALFQSGNNTLYNYTLLSRGDGQQLELFGSNAGSSQTAMVWHQGSVKIWWAGMQAGNSAYEFRNDSNVGQRVYSINSAGSFDFDVAVNMDSGLGVTGDVTATGLFQGTATSARYADVAEMYVADADYEPGTVLCLGGTAEVTQTTIAYDSEVFGVVSTNPALLMNSETDGVAVAFTGRVPVKVVGPVRKGERLISSEIPGVACALGTNPYDPRVVVGRSLEEKTTDGMELIEVVVGVG